MSTESPSPVRRPTGRSTDGAQAQATAQRLLRRAIAGVLRRAQNGDLPLFAWTLGMAQPQLLGMLKRLFPELESVEQMPDSQYTRLLAMLPPSHSTLLALLDEHRAPTADPDEARWLAHALAAACHGTRPLWEEMELATPEDLDALIRHYLPPLHEKNSAGRDWKTWFVLCLQQPAR